MGASMLLKSVIFEVTAHYIEVFYNRRCNRKSNTMIADVSFNAWRLITVISHVHMLSILFKENW